jgi:prepilin-type N-terminal cleavage/methylation domain-containing protein
MIMENNKGYSLVELLIAMGLFTVVAMVISVTFNNLISQGAKQTRSATSQIGGIVGLEMLRTDIAHAGFALPWSYQITPTFTEVSGPPVTGTGINATTFTNFNETVPPHAVLAAPTDAGSTPTGPDYLVLKSALLAFNSPSIGRWGIIDYGPGSTGTVRRIGDANTDVRAGTDRLITLDISYDTLGNESRQLLMGSATNFSYQVSSSSTPPYSPPAAFQAADINHNAYAYAISDTGSAQLHMPYNRADYYVDFNAAKPTSCNPNTGVLYKAAAGQGGTFKDANNTLLTYPLLNCVGDMQVVFVRDPNSNGTLSYDDPNAIAVTSLSAADLRQQLKQVMVYILSHDGGKDTSYTYPGTSITVGYAGAGQTWLENDLQTKFGANWKNYRWKVYGIAVNMPNMQ